eukprot:9087543-Ditylum_brightwellii.AAC.1
MRSEVSGDKLFTQQRNPFTSRHRAIDMEGCFVVGESYRYRGGSKWRRRRCKEVARAFISVTI